MKSKLLIGLMVMVVCPLQLLSQQVADTTYNPVLPHPEYEFGKGPQVLVDEGHNNFHTSTGRYLPFARLLRADGYRVSGYAGTYEKGVPAEAKVIVIANALNSINIERWYSPTYSAFTPAEIKNLNRWVSEGGSLFLIADHMPMGGAAKDLAKSFGFKFTNGFALDTLRPGPIYFLRSEETLVASEVTNGRDESEKISKAVTFTGQAFQAPKQAIPILRFDKRFLLLESDTAWVFDESTKFTNIDGWLQGAYMESGKGRIVFFGEAAMFTSQLAGPNRIGVGLTSPDAEENYRLLLNLMHWLDR